MPALNAEKKCIMYVLKQIKINICLNFVHKGLIYIFYVLLICKVHNFNVHIVKPIGILYYFLRNQYSVDYEIVKI